MAKKKNAAPDERRKLGERTETLEVRLTQIQVEDERAKVIDLIQEKDTLEEEWKSSKAAHKAKIAELDARREQALGAVRTQRAKREIIVEEWLTPRNEVIRVDKHTGEELNRRNATAQELQGDLPGIDKEPPPAPAPPSEDDGETELAKETEADADDDESFGEGD